ncbi:MAG TPA: VOC family protein [Gemmatimonadaceae bacterium]|nr:VOC family protein [Gemmatimonadaceae bacterium]
MHGQFAWYELSTTDTRAALEFYPKFTGWRTQPFDNDYTLFTSGGAPIAGVFRLTDELRAQGVPPNWMPYVEASNVADTAALATSLGAMVVHGPQSIPNVGDIAVIRDPQGATFGVYKSSSGAPSWDGKPVIGHFSWNELMTTDAPKALEFYRRVFGWEITSEMDMGGGAKYYLFGKNGVPYGGLFARFGDMASMPPFWLSYIHVKSVQAAVAAATKGGAKIHRPPMDIPGGVISILGDPQGAGFAVHHEGAPLAAKATPAKKAAKKSKPKAAKKPKKSAKKAKKSAKKAKKSAKKSAKRKPAKKSKSKSSRRPARRKSAKRR